MTLPKRFVFSRPAYQKTVAAPAIAMSLPSRTKCGGVIPPIPVPRKQSPTIRRNQEMSAPMASTRFPWRKLS